MKFISKFKVVAIIVTAVLAIMVVNTQASGNAPRDVFVNGGKLQNKAISVDGVTYVPLQDLSTSLGASVDTSAGAVNISVPNNSTIPSVIQKVSPSVVAIIGSATDSGSSTDYMVGGSGVIIRTGGDILTNAHVVKDMKSIVVVLYDGSAYSARVKNVDEKTDLALIKIDKIGLPAAKFAKPDDLVVGQSVVAIGTPLSFSFRNSATSGIISGINRGIGSDYALIQTDAAINPGNSGGALVNMSGEVIGINSNKMVAYDVEGVGFAITVNTVSYVLDQFEKYGVVVRPNFGAEFEESWAARMGLPNNNGLTVKKLSTGILQAAGFNSNDIIKSIGDVAINSKVDLNECVKRYKSGDSAKVVLTRKSVSMELTIKF